MRKKIVVKDLGKLPTVLCAMGQELQFVEFVTGVAKNSDSVLSKVAGTPYKYIFLIDGNDDRGINVELMMRDGYNIGLMRSHFHDSNGDGKVIFGRDCTEYCVETPEGELIWMLPNHFKSKFGANNGPSQAKRVAAIYDKLIDEGVRMRSCRGAE